LLNICRQSVDLPERFGLGCVSTDDTIPLDIELCSKASDSTAAEKPSCKGTCSKSNDQGKNSKIRFH
jgi:hypothetical protein